MGGEPSPEAVASFCQVILILTDVAAKAPAAAPWWAVPVATLGGALLAMISVYFSDKRKAKLDKVAKTNDKIRDEAADLMRAVADIQQLYWSNRNAWRSGQRGDDLSAALSKNMSDLEEKKVIALLTVDRIGLIAPNVLHFEALKLAQVALMSEAEEFDVADEDRWQDYRQLYAYRYGCFTAHVRHQTGIDAKLQLPTVGQVATNDSPSS